jgi:hypothetical protein
LPDPKQTADFRRVLWTVLGINAVMFLIEIGAGVAADPRHFKLTRLISWAIPQTTRSAFLSWEWRFDTGQRLR